MKTFISLISCSIAASVVAFSICGCGKKDGGADGSRGSAHDWVKPSIPNPDAEGWITLFDGQRLYGCDPANPVFKSGKIFLQGGALWVDSTPIPFQLTAREAVVDIQVKKVSGQNVNITIGRDVGWFNGGSSFGIGRVVDGKYRDLKTGKSSFSFTDFVDMEFLAAGGNLALIAGGQTVTRARDEDNTETKIEMSAFKGVSVFRLIKIKLSDVQSLFPNEENAVSSTPMMDVTNRLRQAKDLYDQGLINKDDYEKRVKEVMDTL